MLITKTSILTGVTRTLDLPVTEEQMNLWRQGMPIQEAMPNLGTNDREFIISGVTGDEWESMFPEEEQEDPNTVYDRDRELDREIAEQE